MAAAIWIKLFNVSWAETKNKRNKKERGSMRGKLALCQEHNIIPCIPRLKLFLFHGSFPSRK